MSWIRTLIPVLALAVGGSAPALAQSAGCTGFKEAMVRVAGDLKPEFIRPLVVSRGAGAGLDNFDLVTRARIDGVLRCKEEAFVGFEAKITLPADARLLAQFDKVQEAALVAALKWAPSRAEATSRRMASDAAEYLRGSQERGDIVYSGRVEEHAGGGVDIGLLWTLTERNFVILTGQ
jgi:hypothetical protein